MAQERKVNLNNGSRLKRFMVWFSSRSQGIHVIELLSNSEEDAIHSCKKLYGDTITIECVMKSDYLLVPNTPDDVQVSVFIK